MTPTPDPDERASGQEARCACGHVQAHHGSVEGYPCRLIHCSCIGWTMTTDDERVSTPTQGGSMTSTETEDRPNDDAGTICGIPYEDGVHIHADARCWPREACSNDPGATCGCQPFGGLCPVLFSPDQAGLVRDLAPVVGKSAAMRYADLILASDWLVEHDARTLASRD